ncbi:MAG: hypothetical protein U0Y08_07980 [Bacteroidia bacterium]
MRQLRLPAALLFLLLCLQVVIPAQLWHELSNHKDTHECDAPGALSSVSELHTHCLVLELTLPGMLNEDQHFVFNPLDVAFSYFILAVPSTVWLPLSLPAERGPPSLVLYC